MHYFRILSLQWSSYFFSTKRERARKRHQLPVREPPREKKKEERRDCIHNGSLKEGAHSEKDQHKIVLFIVFVVILNYIPKVVLKVSIKNLKKSINMVFL